MERELLHVFFVHSPITRAMAEGIIRYRGLDRNDVAVLVSRKQTFDTKFSSNIVDFETEQLGQFYVHAAKKFWRTRAALKKFDDAILSALKGRNFIAYVPHTYTQIIQLLVTHKACKHYEYVEEGLAAYQSHGKLVDTVYGAMTMPTNCGKIRSWLCFGGRLKNGFFYLPGAKQAWGLTTQSFDRIETQKQILPIPWNTDQNLKDRFDNAVLVVLNYIPDQWHYSRAEYWIMLYQVAKILKGSRFKKIVLRFNMDQPSSEVDFIKEAIFGSFENDLEVLEPNYSVEQVCASATISLVALDSSAILYAELMGRETFLCGALFSDLSISFNKHYKSFTEDLSIKFRGRDVRCLLKATHN